MKPKLLIQSEGVKAARTATMQNTLIRNNPGKDLQQNTDYSPPGACETLFSKLFV